MLFKIPNIEMDGEDIVRNIRLNIPNRKQFRLKCTVLHGEKSKDIDLAATEMKFKLNGFNVNVQIIGIDMITKLSVNLTLSVNIFTRDRRLYGVAGTANIDSTLASAEDVKTLMLSLI